ncbi:hypothetical protein V502_10665 [Pseudogymnoascus sp. VKM F-4520 (FW-2644)]|nr:hypothetical protein V502_10665 [Pseudogymnoascus sp. VKM F-4520 (FW-2644)]
MGNHQIQNGEAHANASELEPRMSPLFPAGLSVAAATASLPDTSSLKPITGSVARATSSSSPQLRGDSDDNEEDSDEEDEEDEKDDFIIVERETSHESSSRSSRKRRKAAATEDSVALYERYVSPVKGGKLDAAIRSEMKGLYPDMQPQEIQEKWKSMMELPDRETRFMFLMYFQHHTSDLKETIIAKIIPGLACYTRTHASMRASIMQKWKQMRYKTLKSSLSHVRSAVHDTPQEF